MLAWIGIAVYVSQSAVLFGLNLAVFTISKLELEIEATQGNRHARRVRALREDANFVLTTILWSDVAVNVVLSLLSASVLTGVAAFLFSTVIITILGEIVPQAYFSRHGLRAAAFLAPRERSIKQLIKLHMDGSKTEIQNVEGQGALNFLTLDDIPGADILGRLLRGIAGWTECKRADAFRDGRRTPLIEPQRVREGNIACAFGLAEGAGVLPECQNRGRHAGAAYLALVRWPSLTPQPRLG